MRKSILFGVVGAAGCLVGCLLGEGYWVGIDRFLPDGQAEGSLADPARAPALQAIDIAAAEPPPPLEVASPRANPPRPVPPEIKKRLVKAGAEAGEIEISLSWNGYHDLDLYLTEPGGSEINWNHARSPSGGWLDVDANRFAEGPGGLNSTVEPVEHVRWRDASEAPAGKFVVIVTLFKRFGAGIGPIPYTLHIKAPGIGEVYEGKLAENHKSDLLTFKHPAVPLILAVPDNVIVDQGGVNRLPVRIARNRVTGFVKVTIDPEDATKGLVFGEDKSGKLTIAAEDVSATSLVRAEPFAEPGRQTVHVVAELGDDKVEAETTIVIREVPLAIRLSAPPRVAVPAGASNTLSLRVARDHFEGPVEVRFEAAREGLDLPAVTISADRAETEVTLTAPATARTGEVTVRAVALGRRDGKTCEAVAEFRVDLIPGARASWLTIPLTGGWTALLAMGLSVALVSAQKRYQRQALSLVRMAGVLAAAAVAGLAAGAAGQALRNVLADRQLPAEFGFLGGWLLFGGLLGWGVGWFIPNLKLWKSTIAGLFGGGVGGAALMAPMLLGLAGAADSAGTGGEWATFAARLSGTAVLGFALGLMVAIAETLFREAWIDVFFGPEYRRFTLGSEPVSLGSGKDCTVYVRDAGPEPVRFRFEQGRVLRIPPGGAQGVPVAAGHEERLGQARVVVGTKGAAAAPDALPATPTGRGSAAAPAGLGLRLPGGRRIGLTPGLRLTPRDLTGLTPAAGDGIVAEVVTKPGDASVLGLRNASQTVWKRKTTAGDTVDVPPGRNVALQRGLSITMGELRVAVE